MAYLVRLDDACPTMNTQNWRRMEAILDQHDCKPIVGIIPDSKDEEFTWPQDHAFWQETALRYQNKGWTIGQHGCHHKYREHRGRNTEFQGLPYDEQKLLIQTGNEIMREHGLTPICFFAPSHTYDDTTIAVCRDLQLFDFISDGQALNYYYKNNMLFIPAMHGDPHRFFSWGVHTFVLHPNNMEENTFRRVDDFIKRYRSDFPNPHELLCAIKERKQRSKGIADKTFVFAMTMQRRLRERL
jgi:predicted deacetylase